MFGKDKKDKGDKGKKDNALALRTGEFTPELTDRRRIAVSDLIRRAMLNNGYLTSNDFVSVVERNIVDDSEGMALANDVMARMKRLAQGGEY